MDFFSFLFLFKILLENISRPKLKIICSIYFKILYFAFPAVNLKNICIISYLNFLYFRNSFLLLKKDKAEIPKKHNQIRPFFYIKICFCFFLK